MELALLSLRCLHLFNEISSCLQDMGGENIPLSVSAYQDELARYKIWAENMGAFHGDQRSLDHRLREASQLKTDVKLVLCNLKGYLEDCLSIVSGQRSQLYSSSEGDAD